MSVRRLAEPDVQPAKFAFNKAMAPQVKTWIKKYPKGREQSAVIPLLMLAQEQDGWVTRAAIEHVADVLGMPYIRVLEVATFYTQFQLKPVGTRAHIQVCGTTPCMLRGAEELMDVCRAKIHHEQFHRNDDGTLSWEEVECLGACVNAPMIMVFKDTYEDLTPERLAWIIDEFEAGRGDSVPTGPQVKRTFSAPEGGLTTLKREKDVLKGAKPRSEAAAPAAEATPAVSVPPSNAAKPQTASLMTSPAIKSPSRVKASPKAEKSASVTPPQTAKPKAASKSAAAPKVMSEAEKKAIKPIPLARVDKPLKATKPSKPLKAEAAPAKPALDSADRPKPIERPHAVDDLKLISGVGPKIETTLHELGIFTFAQIAKWTKAEREWADGYLDFHGRIEREDWVKQAAALAKGGVPEYVRVFGRKPV